MTTKQRYFLVVYDGKTIFKTKLEEMDNSLDCIFNDFFHKYVKENNPTRDHRVCMSVYPNTMGAMVSISKDEVLNVLELYKNDTLRHRCYSTLSYFDKYS